MRIYRGKCVFGGIAIGRIQVYQSGAGQVKRRQIDDISGELRRFGEARKEARARLAQLQTKAVRELGKSEASILEIHQMLLDDKEYIKSVEEIIRNQSVNAEYAIDLTAESFSRVFSEMSDEYMKERAADIRDVSGQLLEVLAGGNRRVQMEDPVILLAEDLSPSETVQLNKEKVLSLVTVQGSIVSHTAILARTMGIPALVGTRIAENRTAGNKAAKEKTAEEKTATDGLANYLSDLDGRLAIVDGNEGCLYVDPDEQTLRRMEAARMRELEFGAQLMALKGQESVTLDGRHVRIYANIGSHRDLALAMTYDAEGIGLFRSEYLYLEGDTYPTEEEQFTIYRNLLTAMGEKRVVIRTMDIGADKQADYFRLNKEENPALGIRGIRVCQARPEVFKTQLRALLRAGVYGNLAIMYPMITSLRDVRWIHQMAEEVELELQGQGVPFDCREQGIMIETPAAVMISDLLAREVDFFSIGTNDLTQYTLAMDRQNPAMGDLYDPHHTGVLRMIEVAVRNAHQAGIWCGICGELGADLELTGLFLALGVDELSVFPRNVLPLRKRVRETDVTMCGEEELSKWLDVRERE